jgi:glycosyltransferase involved in cell wall biosynthesis
MKISVENQKTDIHLLLHTRNHMFRAAEGLTAIDQLTTLGTIYPNFKIRDLGFDISKKSTKVNYLLGFVAYLKQKRGLKLISAERQMVLFDKWASKEVKKFKRPGVVHCLSGSALKTFREAKKRGHICVLERSCPHIEFQDELLNEEAALLNIESNEIDQRDDSLKLRMLEEYKLADKIVVCSNYTKNSFLERGFCENNLFMTPCPPAQVIPGKQRLQHSDTPLVFLSVGTSFLRKGFSYLVEAWKGIDPKKARLIIKGPLSEKCKNKLPLGVTHIPERLSQTDLNALYASADVFCLPSIDEGFGMVVLEAMTSGLPVMVSRNVGASDIITEGKDGFVFDIRSPAAIKILVEQFINDTTLVSKMSGAALITAGKHDVQSYQKSMNSFYKTILD